MKRRVIKKSYRAIIYDIKKGRPYFLILHRVLHWDGWEFPKETIKEGETPRETVTRGIKEETQLGDFKIIKKLNRQEKWQAGEINYVIADTFLVRVNMKQKISLKQEIIEHDDYQWVDKENALKKLTWPKTKEIFKRIKDSWLK